MPGLPETGFGGQCQHLLRVASVEPAASVAAWRSVTAIAILSYRVLSGSLE
jgi:hypothetical protein